jgi:hypothetical protein
MNYLLIFYFFLQTKLNNKNNLKIEEFNENYFSI